MSSTKKHVLVAVMGTTPQVLTETLYALCVQRALTISQVRVITTVAGRDKILDKLLHPESGIVRQLSADYPERFQRMQFSMTDIVVAEDNLMPIDDIRNRRQSETFQELILEEVWRFSSDMNTVLHCSLAGGRKTMSTYLALAMQLLGRSEDRLYHLLVEPNQLEHADFYYPRPDVPAYRLQDGSIVEATAVNIDLIDIPFIRLRERFQVDRHASKAGYRKLLEWVQHDLDSSLPVSPLRLDVQKKEITIGRSVIRLQPQEFCLYWYFADRSKTRSEDISVTDYVQYFEFGRSPWFSEEMRHDIIKKLDLMDPSGRRGQRFVEQVLHKQRHLPMSWVLQVRSRINRKLSIGIKEAHLIPLCVISDVGQRGKGKCYGIKLDGRSIEIRLDSG